MVKFEKDKVVITIKDSRPAEKWGDTVHDLIGLLICKDENFTQKHPEVLLLLQEMMPDRGQIEAMYGVEPRD